MSKSTPVSVGLRPELNGQVTAIATALDRPKSWVIEQAVSDYVSLQAWQLNAINPGIAAADQGRFVSNAEVSSWARSWGCPDELPAPECG